MEILLPKSNIVSTSNRNTATNEKKRKGVQVHKRKTKLQRVGIVYISVKQHFQVIHCFNKTNAVKKNTATKREKGVEVHQVLY